MFVLVTTDKSIAKTYMQSALKFYDSPHLLMEGNAAQIDSLNSLEEVAF